MTQIPKPTGPDAWTTDESLPDELPDSPMAIFQGWFEAAQEAKQQPNPTAMSLATATVRDDGLAQPHSRIVLCRRLRDDDQVDAPSAAHLAFFTNYAGAKGEQIQHNARAAATLHWDHSNRQIRVEGPVVKSPASESDDYFHSRHWTKRLGAWSSDQSRPLESRDDLFEMAEQAVDTLGLDLAACIASDEGGEPVHIPRPDHWGGFRIFFETVELWCGDGRRFHDRAVWTRDLTSKDDHTYQGSAWHATRLQP